MTEVFWFSEQPYGHVTEDDIEGYESDYLNTCFLNYDME